MMPLVTNTRVKQGERTGLLTQTRCVNTTSKNKKPTQVRGVLASKRKGESMSATITMHSGQRKPKQNKTTPKGRKQSVGNKQRTKKVGKKTTVRAKAVSKKNSARKIKKTTSGRKTQNYS
jgi:hypothetical protein